MQSSDIKTRTAVLISGSGSNLQALIDHEKSGQANYSIALVIANNGDAYGLNRAAKAGIPTALINNRNFADRQEFEGAIHEKCRRSGIEMILLAGFMRILSPWMVKQWEGHLLNIHPSLLPAFKGLNTHARALECGCLLHGCSVHQVSEALDDGPILVQAAVPILHQDSPEQLAERVLEMEHRAYPLAADTLAAQLQSGKPGLPVLMLHDSLLATG